MSKAGVLIGPALAVAVVIGVHYRAPVFGDFDVSIEGQGSALIGELVELVPVGVADRYSWSADPESHFKVKCNSLFFSARKPGVYVFTLAASTKDDLIQVRHVIVVEGDRQPDKPDVPKPDIPKPDVPKPDAPKPKTLSDKVCEWTLEVKSPLAKHEARDLAALYRAATNLSKNPQELVDSIRAASDSLLGPSKPFWLDWREKVRQEVNALKLKTLQEYIAVCLQIADGLERGAK